MTHNLVTIVQAMQLPVVVLMVIFSFKAPINLDLAKRTRRVGAPILRSPLRFVCVGLVFNFLYLILNILVGMEILNAGDYPFVLRMITLSNLLCAACFLIDPVTHLIARATYEFEFDREVLLKGIAAVVVITLAALWISWKREDLSMHVFQFFAYASLSFYLLDKTVRSRFIYRWQRAGYFIFAGFLVWAFLQPLEILKHYTSLAESDIFFCGFVISTFAKTLILYGLYDLSNKVINYIRRAQTDALLKQVDELNDLQKEINIVTNSANIKALAKAVAAYMTDKNSLAADYAVFYDVDYLRREITREAEFIKDGHNATFAIEKTTSFDARSPLTRVLETHADLVTHESLAGNSIFRITERTLHRQFIPVLHVVGDHSTVISIIEVGGLWITSRTKNLADAEGSLNIYLDNCAQTYDKLKSEQLMEQIETLFNKADVDSRDDQFAYLREVARSFASYLCLDLAILVTQSVTHNTVEIEPVFGVAFNSSAEWTKLQQLFKEHLLHGGSGKPSDTKQRILKATRMQALEVIDIVQCKNTVFKLAVLTLQDCKLNDSVMSVLYRIPLGVKSVYIEKKFHAAVTKLVVPSDAITDPEANLEPAVELLREYFDSDQIAIWLKDSNNDYRVQACARQMKESWGSRNVFLIPKEGIVMNGDYRLAPVEEFNFGKERNQFFNYVAKSNIRQFLIKPLRTHFQNYGFISIGLTTDETAVPEEDLQFLNLSALKILTTIQIHNLVSAFKEISDSFATANELSYTLKIVTDKAMELLNADPVILFRSYDGEHVFFKDITFSYSSDFNDKELYDVLVKQEKIRVELAELILSDRSHYFNTEKDYLVYLRQHRKDEDVALTIQGFWKRERIQSMAAILLTHKVGAKLKPVGVMFINFRTQISFTTELKRIIETFASLATSGIANTLNFDRSRNFFLQNIRMSKPIVAEALANGGLHDANKTFTAALSIFKRVVRMSNEHDTDWVRVQGELKVMDSEMNKLFKEFGRLSTLYRPDQELKISRVNLATLLVKQIETLYAEIAAKHIVVSGNYTKEKLLVECDEIYMGSVFLNILTNACQAVEKRGRLEINLYEVGTGKAKVDIIDDGKGISEDIKDFITFPYVTDKPHGSGLGLAMSDRTVKEHGGTLSYKSQKGRTVFTIEVPIEQNT